jgi:hypothetical protein
MRRTTVLTVLSALVLLLLSTSAADAGFKLKDADGNEKIDLGFRLQVLGINTDRDLDGDGNFESFGDFRIRRARFRLKGTLNEHFGMFFQTDVSGNDIQMIDAYIHLKKNAKFQAFVGQHLAPTSRQTITSSGALMAMDRPGSIYKALTWGGRALSTFDTATYGDSDSGIRGPAQVRDTGVTLFGVNSKDKTHFKWYLGTYDGTPAGGSDGERLTARAQINFGDAESSYYNTSTYLGKKDTVGIGFSYDSQSDVAGARTPRTDYTYYEVDLFAEKPMGDGSVSFEAAYHSLDLDGMNPQAEGDGFYVQAGYLMSNKTWQPWFLYDTWSADAAGGKGSFDLYRVGVSYFMKGHNANLKIGYESFSADANIGSSNEDSIGSLVVGLYTTY